MAFNNAVNATTAGIVGLSAAGVWTGTPVTQYNVLVGGATSQVLVNIAPSATSGVALISQGASANPAYGTVVVAGGGTGLATLTAYALLAGGTTSTGNLQQIALGSAGQVLVSGGAGALPSFQAAPGSFTWSSVAASSQTIAVQNGYVTDNATLVTYTLPATAALGDSFEILGGTTGAGGWTIAQNASQQIHFGSAATTAGVGGSLASTNQYDNVQCRAIVAGAATIWEVTSATGNLTVV
jgi:hypothetical protein